MARTGWPAGSGDADLQPGVARRARTAGTRPGTGATPAATPLADLRELLVERRAVRVEHPLGELLPLPDRDRSDRGDGDRGDGRGDPLLLAGLGPVVEVAREVALERAADLPAVGSELAKGL